MRREPDVPGQVRLAEVLVRDIVNPGDRVEAEPVLRLLAQDRPVSGGEAIAVTHVDDDRGSLEGGLDLRPGRVGRVDGRHGGAGVPGRPGRVLPIGPVAIRSRADGPTTMTTLGTAAWTPGPSRGEADRRSPLRSLPSNMAQSGNDMAVEHGAPGIERRAGHSGSSWTAAPGATGRAWFTRRRPLAGVG